MPPRKAPPGPKTGRVMPNDSDAHSSTRFLVEPMISFYIFATANILAALYAPIQDCDEVFNYWEPTHYLTHGYGLQTWEYSPDYSIRSWLYIALHASVGAIGSLFLSKSGEFYLIRTILAMLCAYCETRLFSTISRVLNPRVGIMFMMVMLFSPGMFHASAAYLPSSFSMYANMLGASAFIDWRSGAKTHLGIMWFGIGGIIGWPFAAALVAPFLVEEIVFVSITKDGVEFVRRVVDGVTRCMLVIVVQLAVEAFFYHKPIIVPWNIVAYNVFSGSGKGPDIFGTEPYHFYIRNLLLNFNIWFLLALASAPVLCLQYVFGQTQSKFTLLRSFFFVAPFYMWLAIFSLQPHKEERFMYPAYPFLGMNAALSLHAVLGSVGTTDPRRIISKIPAKLKLLIVSTVLLASIEAGLLRTIGVMTAYRAPLQIYSSLPSSSTTESGRFVCLGKEWYRFPSSYSLPNGLRAKFIRSEFDGLLPGEFSEAKTGFGLFPGTWLIPSGMNDRNIADPGKYTDIKHCTYLVDTYFPGTNGSKLEPVYVHDTSTWETIRCEKFLDNVKTGLIGRTLWLPDLPIIPERYRRKWGEYCLLRRRGSV